MNVPMPDIERDTMFPITSVCKDDMIQAGLPEEAVDRLTKSDMINLASRLADDYCGQLYWNSLKILGEQTIMDSEIDRVNETPTKDLPILIGSLTTEDAKALLEQKLKEAH